MEMDLSRLNFGSDVTPQIEDLNIHSVTLFKRL